MNFHTSAISFDKASAIELSEDSILDQLNQTLIADFKQPDVGQIVDIKVRVQCIYSHNNFVSFCRVLLFI